MFFLTPLQWASQPRRTVSLASGQTAERFDVDKKPCYLIGRDPNYAPDITIDAPSISRRHAALCHHRDGRLFVIDLASVRSRSVLSPLTCMVCIFSILSMHKLCMLIQAPRPHGCFGLQREGVSVNGQRIPQNKPVALNDGDVLGIGGVKTFRIQGDDALPGQHPEGPSEVRASHLLVKHRGSRNPSSWKEKTVTRSQEEALAMIHGFRERLVSGEATFAELASVESHCGSAQRGGDLGFFRRGQMQRPFEEAAFSLEIGQLSEPVFSDSGVHLIVRTG
jgi:peptidyl-prolyl cis-trans isomerase NIMA-interacting 1